MTMALTEGSKDSEAPSSPPLSQRRKPDMDARGTKAVKTEKIAMCESGSGQPEQPTTHANTVA